MSLYPKGDIEAAGVLAEEFIRKALEVYNNAYRVPRGLGQVGSGPDAIMELTRGEFVLAFVTAAVGALR